MKYVDILKEIANRENVSVKEVETEMRKAIEAAGYDCSVREFIEAVAKTAKKTIYSKSYNI